MPFKDLEQKHNLVNRVILACGKRPTDADINPLLEDILERFYDDATVESFESALAQPEQSYQESMYKQIAVVPTKKTLLPTHLEQDSISTNDQLCAMLRQVHDVLACTALPMKRPWVGLTDEEIKEAIAICKASWHAWAIDPIAFCNYVEAKLKEKNNAV